MLAGIWLGIMFTALGWVVVNCFRFLWRMSDVWFRIFMSLGALGIPISLLLADLHMKLLVSRLYTGAKPLPYAFFSSPAAAVDIAKT